MLHAQSAPLPDAPSSTRPMVNGWPYSRPTRGQDFKAYQHEVLGPRAFIGAGFRSGIEQARPAPIGWGQDFPGYAQRYGSAYAEIAIDSSVRFGLAAALHEDTRYLICHDCSLGAKFKNAVLAEVTNRRGRAGHRVFSAVPIVASFSGPLVAYSAWYPPGYGVEDAAKHSALGLFVRVGGHILRETLFDSDDKD
ncbi:MAG TPA: hypothetical protein VGB94_03035 [Acidobacteriaceae bacterium]